MARDLCEHIIASIEDAPILAADAEVLWGQIAAADGEVDAAAAAYRRAVFRAVTDVCKNLIRIFFLTEGVKKSKGLPAGTQAEALPVTTGGVLGAGVMGGGIAQLFAEKSISTRMKDITTKALALGVQAAAKILGSSSNQGITPVSTRRK